MLHKYFMYFNALDK